MSSTTTAPPDVASAALELIDAATELLLSADFWQMPGSAQADALAKAEQISRRLEYGKLLLLADFHSRDIAGEQAGASTRQSPRSRLHISSSEASRRVHATRELTPSTLASAETVPPELPATATGVAAGELSNEHAQIISAAIRKLSTGLDSATRTAAEVTLASHARDLDPSDLKAVARRLHLYLAQDDTVPDDKPSRNELSFRRDIDGTSSAAASTPKPPPPSKPPSHPHATPSDCRRSERSTLPRPPLRRRARGVKRASPQPRRPPDAGEKPHLTATISLNDLQAETGHATLNTGTAISVEAARRIACDATIIPIVLGSEGEPLDVGRATRVIPIAIRRAVVSRDIGCIHPDCDALPFDARHIM